jgi:hypothetical protein
MPFSLRKQQILLSSNTLLWDTGSSFTALFAVENMDKTMVGLAMAKEGISRKFVFSPIFFTKSFKRDSLTVSNLFFAGIKTELLSDSFVDSDIEGILGMNVIGKTNWLIDFETERIRSTLSFEPNENPVLVLSFSSLKRPKISITINDSIKIDNILFDTGSDDCLTLLEEDIQKISVCSTPVETFHNYYSGLYTDSVKRNVFLYKQMNINGLEMDSIAITQEKTRLMGTAFLKRFAKVFFDSKNGQIKFYKSE